MKPNQRDLSRPIGGQAAKISKLMPTAAEIRPFYARGLDRRCVSPGVKEATRHPCR